MLYRIFNIVFVVLFAIVAVLIVFNNATTWVTQSWVLLLVAALAGTLVIFIITRAFFLIPEPKRKLEFVLVPVLLVGLFVLQLVIAWNLWPGFTGESDYSQIYLAAQEFVKEELVPTNYLQANPSNAGLYTLWCLFFSILDALGQADFTFPTMVVNALAIDGAVLLLYFAAHRLFGGTKALFMLVAAFFVFPFIGGAAIASADSIILPIPIAAVLLWLHARSNWREEATKRAYLQACVAGALLGIGALFKLSILVIWIAIAVDLLILLYGKKRLLLLLASFGSVVVFSAGLGAVIWLVALTPSFAGLSLLPAAGAAAVSQTTGFGIFDMVMQYMDRLSYAFGDGTFGLAGELERSLPSVITPWASPSGAYFSVTAYATFAVEFGMLVWMVVSAAKSIYRQNDALSFARVALFGMTLYLLIWSAGPRTLVSLLPLVMLCALEAAPIKRHRIAKKRAEEAKIDAETDWEKVQMRSGVPKGKYRTQSIPVASKQPLPEAKTVLEQPDYMDPGYGLAKSAEEKDPEELLRGALGYAHSLAAEREQQKDIPPVAKQGENLWDYMDE